MRGRKISGSLTAVSLVATLQTLPSYTQASPIEAFSSNPQVQVKNGTIRGYSIPDLGAEAFLGITYAQAPVSEGFLFSLLHKT
jgi:hypothetical protein